jgi:hypothetical protein
VYQGKRHAGELHGVVEMEMYSTEKVVVGKQDKEI